MRERWKVVIIGGGFGGLSAAQHLNSSLVDVTLIDRRNYHLFQPLLYQVATGSLSAGQVASPLRSVLSRQKSTRVWLGTVVDVDPDSFTDKDVAIPMILGVRIADGVMAIKANNAELLNKCAADIEKLAKKMGVADADLGRARAVRAAANKGEWLKVFMELGFLQQDIMKKIDQPEHATHGTLLIVCGWMEGARYTSTVVDENYSAETSNLLREPMLAKALKGKIEGLPANLQSSPLVAKLREVLPQIERILTIPLDGTISKENVGELNRLATEVVKAAMGATS